MVPQLLQLHNLGSVPVFFKQGAGTETVITSRIRSEVLRAPLTFGTGTRTRDVPDIRLFFYIRYLAGYWICFAGYPISD